MDGDDDDGADDCCCVEEGEEVEEVEEGFRVIFISNISLCNISFFTRVQDVSLPSDESE